MQFPGLAEYTDWGLLVLRLAVGAVFIVHGLPKLRNAKGMAEAFGGAKPPVVAMITVQGLVEVIGGVALTLGLLTQLVAIATSVIMIGAIALKNTQWKTGFMAQQTTGWEFDLVVLAGSIVLLLAGPGSIAIQR